MRLWPVVELDLAAPPAALPAGAPVVRCLVFWDATFLGETDVQPGRRSAEALHADLLDDFRDAVSAVRLLPPAPVPPGSDVTVAVLVRDRSRTHDLDRCLDAVAALVPPPADVLVVGAPGRPPVRTVAVEAGTSPLQAAGRACRTPLLLLTDERSRPTSGWLAAMRRGFELAEVAAVTGLVTPGELEATAQELVDRHLRDRSPARLVPQLSTGATASGLDRPPGDTGASLGVRREVLLELGAGAEPARRVEDVELVVRVLATGRAVLSTPDAVVLRTPARTPVELLRERWQHGAGQGGLLAHLEQLSGPWSAAVAQQRADARRTAARAAGGAVRHRQWLRLAALAAEAHGRRAGAAPDRLGARSRPER